MSAKFQKFVDGLRIIQSVEADPKIWQDHYGIYAGSGDFGGYSKEQRRWMEKWGWIGPAADEDDEEYEAWYFLT